MKHFNIINQLSVLEGEGRGSRKQEMKARERSEGLKSNLIPAVPSRKNENFLTKYSPRVPNRLKRSWKKNKYKDSDLNLS